MATPGMVPVFRRLTAWAFLIALTYVFWKWLAVYVFPFGIAGLIALALEPVVERLTGWGVSHVAAIWLALLGGLLSVFVVLGLLITIVAAELAHLAGRLPVYVGQWQTALDRTLGHLAAWRSRFGLSSPLLNAELHSGARFVEGLLRHLSVVAGQLPSTFMVMMVAAVAVFFILRDGKALRRQGLSALPEGVGNRLLRLQAEVVTGTIGLLKAQLFLVTITATGTAIGLSLIGSRYAVVLGLVAGLLDLIPFLGPTALIVPWSLLLVVMGDMLGAAKLLLVMLAVALTRQTVEPRLVGGQTGLHPLFVLLSVYVGIRLFGPIGFVVGPISAVMLKAESSVLFDLPPLWRA